MKPSRIFAIRLLVAVACGIASAVLGSTSAAADDGPDLAAIDRYVRSEMDAQRIPGLALGIVHGDRIVHVQGFGQAERSGRDVTPQTPFLIGSVTKSFTALAIMQLSEAGRVQLDAPVQRYLPWWRVADPDASTRVTVRHLLYQVSGLSKATGNAYATSGDTHDSALEDRVRALRDAELTAAGRHDLAVQQRQLLDPGHDRAGGLGPVLRDLHPAAHLRPAADGQLLHVGDRGGAARPAHGPPLLVRLPRRLRTALRSRRPGFPRPQLQRAGHDRLPQPLPQPVADMAPPRWSHPPVPPSCSGPGSPPAWTASRTRWAGTWAQIHGIPTISHDGSGFDSHANVVLIPDRGWGVVVMENGENSPDEFFGSRRMTGIAYGVAGLLIGEEPPATSSSRSLWVVYGVVLGILVIQVAGMIRSVRTIRGWRTDPIATSDGSPADRAPSGPAPSRELDLGSSRAGRTATGHPRAAAGRADGTARPRLPAGRQRSPRLRLGPGQSHLGNPHFAHSAFRRAWPLDGRHHPSDPRNRAKENRCPPRQLPRAEFTPRAWFDGTP